MIAASQKLVEPQDCGIAFGLPLTEEEVRNSLEESCTKDWVKFFSSFYGNPRADRLWPDYYGPQVAMPANQLIHAVSKLGVTVYERCSLAQLSAIAGRHVVFTLVSHWREDGEIELTDGMHPAERVAAALPAGYNQVLDLMICQSVQLADAIKKQHPDCACLCNARPTRLRPKLFLYGQTQLALKRQPSPYPDAVFATYREFSRREKR